MAVLIWQWRALFQYVKRPNSFVSEDQIELTKRESYTFLMTFLPAIRAANTDTLSILARPKFWLIIVSVTAICFLSGPFGTLNGLPVGVRLIYWALQVVLGGMAGLWCHALIRTQGWTALKPTILVSLLFGVAVAGLVILVSLALLEPIGRFPGYLDLVFYSFPSAFIIFLVLALVSPWQKPSLAPTAPVQTNRPKLLDRLKKHIGAEQVLSLSAQDHYVEVVTENGPELCLIRLADAIAEVHPVQGIQLHRSHWVAKSAIETLEASGAVANVLLKDGRKLAVSKSRLADLKAFLKQ